MHASARPWLLRGLTAAAFAMIVAGCQNQRTTEAEVAEAEAATPVSTIRPAYPTIDPAGLGDDNLVGVLDAALAGCQTATYAGLRQEMARRADLYSAQAAAGIATPEAIVQRDRFLAVLGATPAGDPCPPRVVEPVPVRTGSSGYYVAPSVGVGIGGGSNGVGAGIGFSLPIF